MRRIFAAFLLLGTGLAQSYTITLAPVPVSVAPGQSAKSTLAVLPDGFTGTLPIHITGLPAGVTYSPNAIAVSDPTKNATVEIVFTAAANAPNASSITTIQVGTQRQFFSVVVDPAAQPPSENPANLEAIWRQVQQ